MAESVRDESPLEQRSGLSGDLVVRAEKGVWSRATLFPPPTPHDDVELVIPAPRNDKNCWYSSQRVAGRTRGRWGNMGEEAGGGGAGREARKTEGKTGGGRGKRGGKRGG